ncbi:mu-type opioid receptor [Hippopotamus amphibius kiboko]|uniref:mu-type opioid receptor n=1 Tax=Hippopotamus amphibius kiboko TaxID=575201 RepID=UPI002593A5FE|nr:mu-type opioid receptor [Hippopotamus amphibius kiboko]
MDSSAVPRNDSNCTDPFTHSSSCSPAPSPSSWVNFSHLEGNLSDPCGPNRTELGRSDSLCPSTGSPSMITAITIMALYSIVCVVGLFGNFLVMYVIVRYTKMKTATNIYIFNLALADALATSTLPFQSVNYLMGTWPFGTILCKIVISIDYYNMFTSIFTLCTMSVDRYIAVCHPVKALDFRTPRNAKIVNICNWILSSAIGLPVMFMATTKYRQGSIDCTLTFSHPTWYWENLLKICVFIFAFIMPVLIITVCYGLMILRLKSVRMLSGSKEKDRNLRRITRMVLVVVAVFIVCWTPIHIYVIIKALITIPETTFQTVSWHFCIALGYTNSCLNPVLYAFLDENFKRCFREFCIPTSSTIEQQNSTRIRQNTRDHPSTANTVDRTNHQEQAITKRSHCGPHVVQQRRILLDYVTIETTRSQKVLSPALGIFQSAGHPVMLPFAPLSRRSCLLIEGSWKQAPSIRANIRHRRSKNEQMSHLCSQLLSSRPYSLARASVTQPKSNWNKPNPPPALTGRTIWGKAFNHSELSFLVHPKTKTYLT